MTYQYHTRSGISVHREKDRAGMLFDLVTGLILADLGHTERHRLNIRYRSGRVQIPGAAGFAGSPFTSCGGAMVSTP
jgi:hypothetical protein